MSSNVTLSDNPTECGATSLPGVGSGEAPLPKKQKKVPAAELSPEDRETRRATNRRHYHKKKNNMTPEELDALRESGRLRMASWRAMQSPEKLSELSKRAIDWKTRNPDKVFKQYRNWWLKNNYGISLEDYESMVESQSGCCKICSSPTTKLVVDHCHTTGRVRGLLCSPCNTGLGHFKDDPDRILNAAIYLSQPDTNEVSNGCF